MAIRPEAFKVYFSKREDECRLAHNLDEAFDINFGSPHGQLSFWLAEPKAHIKERFGLQQEILIIYSPHIKTDARILTAIEQISRSPDFRHRIEKVLFILIHSGEIKDTTQLLKNQTDRVIVSIHSKELLSPRRGSLFVSSRIAHVFGQIDLFGMSSPITSDKYFFGRDKLVQDLSSHNIAQKQNSGLFGLRKTGKTSVLFAIKRRFLESSILIVYVDCQNPGIHATRWWQLLENIIVKFISTLKNEKLRNVPKTTFYNYNNAGFNFSSDIKSLLQIGKVDKIILMLDEIEYITPGLGGKLGPHWDDDFLPFWQTIRSIHQETGGNFSFIVAGVNPSCVETSHWNTISNPIFQLAVPYYLEPLSVLSIREMARSLGRYSGLKFEEPVYKYLKEAYGGHPFLIRIACSEVWKSVDTLDPQKLSNVSVKNFLTQRPNIQARLAQPIKDILLSLVWWYPEEYELLEILAEGDEKFVAQYLESSPRSLIQFAKYGILNEEKSEFAISDVRDFLRRYGESYKKEISPFSRGDMPPDLLPEIPDLEELGKLFEKRTQLEIMLRKAIIMYLGVKNNWNPSKIADDLIKALPGRNDRKDPSSLFVGRSPQDVINDLYTLDLKQIIIKNWDIFGPLFDKKERFEMNMDTINKARRVDSHTKPFAADEKTDFMNSYAWLHVRLCKIPAIS
jgi:hypothetical protein